MVPPLSPGKPEKGKAVPLAAGDLPGDGGERPVAASPEREAVIEHLHHQVAALEGAYQQRPRQGQTPVPRGRPAVVRACSAAESGML